ncbi:type II secretion system protein GspG [Microgenomates group bacterium]|nr:type II secretion system protein GspG [Microgenomates group bacterium]
MKKNHGFSLIELMVVIAIIAILAVIGINGYSSAVRKGRDARRKADVNAIAQALALYRMDKNKYPSNEEYLGEAEPSLLDYITDNQLWDPDKKNKGRYFYYCWEGTGAASSCRSFLVCAQVEQVDSMNWEWDDTVSGFPPTPSGASDSNVVGATTSPVNLGGAGNYTAPNSSSVSTNNWYCVSSI